MSTIPEMSVSQLPAVKKSLPKILRFRDIAVGAFFVLVAVAGLYFFANRQTNQNASYADSYRLVPEKLSQSAVIRISLPKGVDKILAQQGVAFDPEIKGAWVKDKPIVWWQAPTVMAAVVEQKVNTNFIAFKPQDPLDLNRHYAVKVDLGEGKILASDFLVAPDPKVVAIFPATGSEAPADSKITVVFNRPMVPVTTIDQLESQDIPVEISPATLGKFKWISSNTLQFIPKDYLKMSANYTVKIKQGFVSLDGLGVADFASAFQVLKLRYAEEPTYTKIYSQIYNQPIRIYFNQPVNLDKTKAEIKLFDKSANKEVPFVAEYAIKTQDEIDNNPQYKTGDSFGLHSIGRLAASIFNFSVGKKQETDQSAIEIYPQKDSFGRSKFWDFEKNYTVIINKAYSVEGDIILDTVKTVDITTAGVVSRWFAVSDRTNLADLRLFDPQGYLAVTFFEDIDLSKSRITTPNLQKIEYGQKCQDEKNYDIVNCEKVQDNKTIKIYFQAATIKPGDHLSVNLEKVVDIDGLQINRDTISNEAIAYSPLKISLGDSTKSYDSLSKKHLNGFYLCSNNPLLAPDKKEFKQKITGNLDLQINSFYQSSWAYEGSPCPLGTIITQVVGGFSPDSDYNLNLDINDVFGQNIKQEVGFITGSMEPSSAYAFGLQQGYSVTSPQDTVLNFGAVNVSYVDLQICRASAVDFEKMYEDNNINSSACSDYQTKRINLPERYWINNYFSINLADYFTDPIGNYAIALGNPLFSNNQGRKFVSFVTVTNLAVAEKSIAPATDYLGSSEERLSTEQINSLKNLYWVTNIKTQDPLPGVALKFYGHNGNLLGAAITDNDGLSFPAPAIGVSFVVASLGNDSTVVVQNNDKLNWSQNASNYKKTYIYTDKPLYRPEQTAHIKGILRIGYDGNYEMFNNKTIDVKVNNSQGIVIADKNIAVNDFGTFNFDFALDRNSPLGSYNVCVQGSYDCAYFEILEYVPSAFQVSQSSSKSEYISKDTANLEVDANYYFGAPVDTSAVSYTISSQNYYFDKYSGGEWFNFGSWDDDYYSNSYYYGDKFILRGSGLTDKDGKFKFAQKFDLQEMLKSNANQGSRIIVVDSTVKNNLGQSVSNQQSFIVHAGNYYIGVKTDPYFTAKNKDFNLKVKTVDVNGKDLAVSNIAANIYAIDWVYAKRQEVSGALVYKWEEKKDLVKTINFSTDNNGDWSGKIKLDKEGQYDIELTSHDGSGNLIKSKTSIYVYGEGQASFNFDDSVNLDLKANKTELKAGEQGQLIIKSPYAKSKALITIERGKIFDYKIVDFTGNILGYNFTATDDYSPNVFVSVLLQSPDPAVKFGSQEFKIDSDKSKINLEVTSDKKFYNPGDQVNLSVVAKDSAGNPLKTEVSVAVVDLSVLALKGNPKKDPLVFFYNGLPLTVSTASNIKNKIARIDPADISNTKGGSGGGGADNKIRGDFKETAFWSATTQTGDDGHAQISFKLPDNLTTWQTEVLGITKDTKLGVSYLQFQSKKELMVVPLKPRFIMPGDAFSIGASIFNQSDSDKTFQVTFKSDTLKSTDNNATKKIKINQGEQKTVYFAVKAPVEFNRGIHTFTIAANGGGLEDAVAGSIVVRQNSTYEVTATANYTQGDDAREIIYLPSNVSPTDGDLTLKSSATLAVFLSDALSYLINYPYGCSEQISSKLKAIALIKSGLQIPNLADKFKLEKVEYQDKEYTIDQLVDIGLAGLYKNQNYDGGFNMWGNGGSDYFVTLKVVDSLNALRQAKYTINDDSLNRGTDYLYGYYNSQKNITNDEKISLALVLMQTDRYKNNSNLTEMARAIINNDSVINDKLSQKALGELGVMVNIGLFDASVKTKINNSLDNRVNIDSRGAFLEGKQNNYYYNYFESTIGDTALYLKSLALGKRDTAITDKIVRWLLNSRDKDGVWESTQNTLAVVEAFTDYLNWKKETEAVYTLDTLINGKTVDTFALNASTILDQNKKTIAMTDLKINDYNTLELKKTGTGSLYYDMALKYYLNGNIQPRDEGFAITRQLYALDDKAGSTPLTKAKAGDLVREHLTIVVPVERRNVQIEDFIPAGLEIVDLSLATESKDLRFNQIEIKAPEISPDFKEIRDDRAYIFTSRLAPGVYEFDYYLRALVPGSYSQLPAIVSEMYSPENFGRTGSADFKVTN